MAQDQTGLSTRQKVTAVAIVIILLIVVWQLMGLFKGNSAEQPKSLTQAPLKPMNAAQPQAGQMAQANPAMMSPQQPGAGAPSVQNIQPQSAPVSKDMELLRIQQETQEKYISALNDLQMLRLQRDISETNQAIMQAKLATVTAEKNINDLLVKPSGISQVAMPGGYAAQLSSGQPGQPQPQPAQQPATNDGYVVVSVAYQLNHWSAVLGLQGKLMTVNVGDVLPADGSVVSQIDREGVVLEKDGKKRRISLVGGV